MRVAWRTFFGMEVLPEISVFLDFKIRRKALPLSAPSDELAFAAQASLAREAGSRLTAAKCQVPEMGAARARLKSTSLQWLQLRLKKK